MLDLRGTLVRDIGKGRRTNHSKERKRMVRCRYQGGCLFIRGKKRKMWVARWRENVIQPDGVVQRVLRSAVLGPVSEFAGRREARVLLQSHLASLNSGQRQAEGTMPFAVFVTEHFEPAVLPTLKYATQEIYSLLLRKHLLPRFRDSRLCCWNCAGRGDLLQRTLWHSEDTRQPPRGSAYPRSDSGIAGTPREL